MQKLIEVPQAQRLAEKRALTDFAKTYSRQEAAARAYLSGHHTMATIADYFNVHYATISRWVKGYEGKVLISRNARLDPDFPITKDNLTMTSQPQVKLFESVQK